MRVRPIRTDDVPAVVGLVRPDQRQVWKVGRLELAAEVTLELGQAFGAGHRREDRLHPRPHERNL